MQPSAYALEFGAPRCLPPVGTQNKEISFQFFIGSSPHPSTEKAERDISLFWDRRFVLQKALFQSPLYLRDFHFTFLRTRGVRGALAYTERVVYLAFAHITLAPPHSSLTPFARAAAVLPCVSSMASLEQQ